MVLQNPIPSTFAPRAPSSSLSCPSAAAAPTSAPATSAPAPSSSPSRPRSLTPQPHHSRLEFRTGAFGIPKGLKLGVAQSLSGAPRPRPTIVGRGSDGDGGLASAMGGLGLGAEDGEASVRVGEDAFFIGEHGHSLGIADGVGGWSKRNIPGANAGEKPLRPGQGPP